MPAAISATLTCSPLAEGAEPAEGARPRTPRALDIAALSSFIAWVAGLVLIAPAVLATNVLPRTPAV